MKFYPISQQTEAPSEPKLKFYPVKEESFEPPKEEGFLSKVGKEIGTLGTLAGESFKKVGPEIGLSYDVLKGEVDPEALAEYYKLPTTQTPQMKQAEERLAKAGKKFGEAKGFVESAKELPGFLGALGKELYENPKAAIQLGASGAAGTLTGIGAGLAGTFAGGAAGTAVGTPGIGTLVGGYTGATAGYSAAGIGPEFANRVRQELAARGLSESKEDIAKLASDKKFIDRALSEAKTKAITSAAVEGAGSMVGAKVVTKPLQEATKQAAKELGKGATKEAIEAKTKDILSKRTFGQKAVDSVARPVAGYGIEVGSAGLGEAAGSLAATGEIDYGDALLSMYGEIGAAPAELAGSAYGMGKGAVAAAVAKAREQAKTQQKPQPKQKPQAKPQQTRVEPTFDGTYATEDTQEPIFAPGAENDVDVQVPEEPIFPTPEKAVEPEVTPTVEPSVEPTVQPTVEATKEEPAPQNGEPDFPIVMVNVADIKQSNELLPQFKMGANEKGIVNPIKAPFTQEGVGPIALWERTNGDLYLASGRHRHDAAVRSGTEKIAAQIYKEADGYTQMDMAIKDAELNIRDDQGEIKDYVNYFKQSGIDEETAKSKGLLARNKGQRGFTIANSATDALIDSINGGQINDEAAYTIATTAPNNEALQNLGLNEVINRGKSAQSAGNLMQAAKVIAREQGVTQLDMFGFDDSGVKEAREMEKIVHRKQREIQTRLSAITGASRNPAVARAEGIDLKDENAIKARIAELKQAKEDWVNWSTNPALVDIVRQERGVPPPYLKPVAAEEEVPTEPTVPSDQQPDMFGLASQTPEEAAAEQERKEKEAQAAAEAEKARLAKEKADKAAAGFVLTGSDSPADIAIAHGQQELVGSDATITPTVKSAEDIPSPDFKQGKTPANVAQYYEGIANQIKELADAKDAQGLQDLKANAELKSNGKPGAAWQGKSANSKLLLDYYNKQLAALGVKVPTGKPPQPVIGAKYLAERQVNAATRFIDAVVEQFGLTQEQAKRAMNTLLKEKVLKLDPIIGQFNLKDGRFWNRDVILRASEEVPTEEGTVDTTKTKENAEKLRQAGEKLIADSEEDLNRDRLANTSRRATMAGIAENRLREAIRIGKTMIALADAMGNGELKLLNGITSKAAVEELDMRVKIAVAEADRNVDYADRNKDRKAEPKDISYAQYPKGFWSDWFTLEKVHKAVEGKRGSVAFRDKYRYETQLPSPEMYADIQKVIGKDAAKELFFNLTDRFASIRRLEKAGITESNFKDALVEFLKYRGGETKRDPIKEAERALVGQKVGFDFFPTPPEVAKQMVEMAGITDGMKVLEPSAGNGNLADAAKAAGADVDVVEVSSALRNILELKGYNLVANDFETFETDEKYDVVLMNPPFSDRKDAEHIQRAWNMLKPGGKLVAIAGEGVFFGSDKKAQEFRQWLDDNGADVEKLPANTFKGANLPAQTGANARLITLKKPETAAKVKPARLTKEPIIIDVEAVLIDDNVALLPNNQILTLENHYGNKRKTADFVQKVKEDIVRFANEGAEAVAEAIRDIIRKLHAGVLSIAVIINPTNITPPEFVFHPSYTYTTEEQVFADVPATAARRMSPSAQQSYKVLYPSIKDRLIKDNKFMVIADKPSARVFVFRPDGSLLLDKKSLFGLTKGDFYKGNAKLPQNRITPAGYFTMGLRDATRSPSEARTAGEYDFKKVFVLDKALGGKASVTLFHSVWLGETDADARARALENEDATDSRYSFGCINVDKKTYSMLVDKHLQQMDGAALFIIPDDPENLAAMLSGKQVNGDELTRTEFKPATKQVTKIAPAQSAIDNELQEEVLADRRRPLYRKDESKGAQVKGLDDAIVKSIAGWENAPDVVLADNMDDARIPQEVRDDFNATKEVGDPDPKGFYFKGTVYVLRSRAESINDALTTLYHEAFGHAALRREFGKGLKPILEDVIKYFRKDVMAIYDDYTSKANQKPESELKFEDLREAAEEYLARLAETRPNLPVIRRLVAYVRSFLRKIGFNVNLTNDEIIAKFIIPARNAMIGRGKDTAQDGDIRYSKEGKVGTESGATGFIEVDGVQRPIANSSGQRIHQTDEGLRNFWRWFGDSKVVDDQGRPLVVYHGTKSKFTVFDTTRGIGSWFTADRQGASLFGDAISVYLKIKNPGTLADLAAARRVAAAAFDPMAQAHEFNAAVIADMERRGFDGVNDTRFAGAGGDGAAVFVAFHPEKNKSATGNIGTYDADNPDIRYSKGKKESENLPAEYYTPVTPTSEYKEEPPTDKQAVKDDEALLEKYARPDTPLTDNKTIKEFAFEVYDDIKETLKEVLKSPREAVKDMGNNVTDLAIGGRTTFVFSGAGVEARDMAKYGGLLEDSEGLAVASIAIDQATRSGNIAVEVIKRGGISYNKEAKMFQAVRTGYSMVNVYKEEGKLRKKLGRQLAANIINGYFEGRRSIDIMEAYEARDVMRQDAEQMLAAARSTEDYQTRANITKQIISHLKSYQKGLKDANGNPQLIADIDERIEQLTAAAEAMEKKVVDENTINKLRKMVEDARKLVENIMPAVRSITMLPEEMQEFAALDKRHPELKVMADNWRGVNRNIVRFWYSIGKLTQEAYRNYMAMDSYVPWNRIMEEGDEFASASETTTRTLTNIPSIKKFKKGRPERKTIIRVTKKNMKTEMRDEVGVKITVDGKTSFVSLEGESQRERVLEDGETPTIQSNTLKTIPTSGLRVFVNGVQLEQDQYSIDPQGNLNIKAGIKIGDTITLIANREINNIVDNMTRSVMRMTINGLRHYAATRIVGEYATRLNDKQISKENALIIFRDDVPKTERGKIATFDKPDKALNRFTYIHMGVPKVVEIQDPWVAAAIYGLADNDPKGWAQAIKASQSIGNFIRRSVTLTLAFQLKQVFLDAPSASFITGVQKPMALMRKAWASLGKAMNTNNPTTDLLKSFGYGGYYSVGQTPELEVKRQIGVINKNVGNIVASGLDYLSDTADMPQRIATFERIMDETGDMTRALYMSGYVFNPLRRGTSGFAQTLHKLVPFLSAYINSTDTLIRTLVGSGLKGISRKQALKRVSQAFAMLALLNIAYVFLAMQSDDYEELDDETKLKHYILPSGIKLPANNPVLVLTKQLPEILINQIFKDATENEWDAERLKKAYGKAFLSAIFAPPTPVPAGAKEALEVTLNRSFHTNRAITPEYLQDLPTEMQFTAYTSELGKLIGQTGLIAPTTADHLTRAIFGSTGATAQWAANSIVALQGKRPTPELKEAPIIGPFIRKDVGRGKEQLFYDLKADVDAASTAVKRAKDAGLRDEARKYAKEYRKLLIVEPKVDDLSRRIKELNKKINSVSSSKTTPLSADRRREIITKLEGQKQKVLSGIATLRRKAYSE